MGSQKLYVSSQSDIVFHIAEHNRTISNAQNNRVPTGAEDDEEASPSSVPASDTRAAPPSWAPPFLWRSCEEAMSPKTTGDQSHGHKLVPDPQAEADPKEQDRSRSE